MFTQLLQIRDLWDNGNGIQIKKPNNMRRLLQLSNEMLNILSEEKKCQSSNDVSITEIISLDETFISPIQIQSDSRSLTKSTISSDKLETIIKRTIYDDISIK